MRNGSSREFGLWGSGVWGWGWGWRWGEVLRRWVKAPEKGSGRWKEGGL